MSPKLEPKHIFTLHRYFIWADRMRVHFDKAAKTGGLRSIASREGLDVFLYMSAWYGSMYVVIEGWRKLGLSDHKIDQLLNSPNVELLKRYRNGVYHFQKDYFDNRFLDFMKSEGSATWIRELRQELSRFFLDWFAQKRVTPKYTK